MDWAQIIGYRFYFGSAPIFAFSIIIYALQFAPCLYSLRKQKASVNVGLSCLLLVVSYSMYELAFKLSFIAYGWAYVNYFLQYDTYQSTVFAVTILSLLAVKDRFRITQAVPFFVVAGYVWVLWFLTGYFPANVQSYEQTPTLLPLLYNLITKALVSVGVLRGLVA
jgi:hypothetical protein